MALNLVPFNLAGAPPVIELAGAPPVIEAEPAADGPPSTHAPEVAEAGRHTLVRSFNNFLALNLKLLSSLIIDGPAHYI